MMFLRLGLPRVGAGRVLAATPRFAVVFPQRPLSLRLSGQHEFCRIFNFFSSFFAGF
jgi:hypothetical protein